MCNILHIKTHLCTYVRKRNHKCFKLESDKGRQSRKARRALGKGHFHFGLPFWTVKGLMLRGVSNTSFFISNPRHMTEKNKQISYHLRPFSTRAKSAALASSKYLNSQKRNKNGAQRSSRLHNKFSTGNQFAGKKLLFLSAPIFARPLDLI